MPLPIGFGQTNSQPSTVYQMLAWLQPEPGDKVLDVGSGSGWTTALLAWLVAPKGTVYATEIIPELFVFGKQNCARAGITNVRFEPPRGAAGLPDHAPYDRILVSAAAKRAPDELVQQLAPEGILVIPVRDTIWVIEKNHDGTVTSMPHAGYAFVPLVDRIV